MRIHLLFLLSITGLSPNIGNAGTLAGDWYLEDSENVSIDERLAFSQPVSQSNETIRVTLGIKSPGAMDPVDFYLIVSSNTTDSVCQYTVKEIVIDSRSFPVGSPTHSSEISQLTTNSEDEQTQLWREFRKGQNLSLKINQTCNAQDAPISVENTFDFSLKGSNAAYRFVTGQEAKDSGIQEVVKNKNPINTTYSKDLEVALDKEPSQSILILILAVLFIGIVIASLFKRHTKPVSIDIAFDPISRRTRPNTVAGFRGRGTSNATANRIQSPQRTSGAFNSDEENFIASLPRFKVEYVVDGDTVIVSTSWHKLTIRLDAIDCPEDGQEWGDIATAGLIKLIGGKEVYVEEHGTDRYERTIATLYLRDGNNFRWMNVNERMVTLGHAWVMRKYYDHLPKHRQDQLNKLERWAKSKRVGLWGRPNPVPPWNWRRGI